MLSHHRLAVGFVWNRIVEVALVLLFTVHASSVKGETLVEGARLVALTDDGKSRAWAWAWHGDKTLIEREVSETQSQLVVMNSDGSNEQPVTPIGNPFFAQWSWTGDRISYEFSNADLDESQGGVFIYELASGRTLPVSAPYSRGAIDEDEGPFWSADDRFVAYKVRPGPARSRQVWVAETATGKMTRLLPNRGQLKDQRWSPGTPSRLCLLVQSSGEEFDVAIVAPDGRDLVLLTNIGAELIDQGEVRWSPAGDWIAFTSDADMTHTERERRRGDCWIARPNGLEARNLTKASSPATEEQLAIDDLAWSWDGRWIVAPGERFDIQGIGIPTIYLVDPVEGGYSPILTSRPRETAELDWPIQWEWSYDSTKIAIFSLRHRVTNWGKDAQGENRRTVLSLYDIDTKVLRDILVFSDQLDRKQVAGRISWSPDSKSILLTIASIISMKQEITLDEIADYDEGVGIRRGDVVQPDVYRLDLPEALVSASAAEHDGPPMGRGKPAVGRIARVEPSVAPVETQVTTPAVQQVTEPAPEVVSGESTWSVRPEHITVEEAKESLPTRYSQYLSLNTARNQLIFCGPSEMFESFLSDLELVDSPAPHVLVDLLAVEMSDEATRELGLDWTYAKGRFAFFQPEGNAIRDLTPGIEPGGLFETDDGELFPVPVTPFPGINTFPGSGQAFYQGVGKLPREFFVRLSMLEKAGRATILANPRNVAVSGKESSIQIRKTLNYFFTEGYDVAGRPIVKKSDISADTTGRIKPILLPDGRIYMTVDVSVGTFTFTPEQKLPELTTRESTTEVTVGDGDTIVIGGLRQQESVMVDARVPILGSIPALKHLFKKNRRQIRHSVLTIFITPHVLDVTGPSPEWEVLNGDQYNVVPIMEDKTIEDEAKHPLTPEWASRVWQKIKAVFSR